jgi:hypothetical protein
MLLTEHDCQDMARMIESSIKEKRYAAKMKEIQTAFYNDRLKGGRLTEEINLRTLYEAVVPDGREALRQMDPSQGRQRGVFFESGGPVKTAHFSNLIGQIMYGDTLAEMESPAFIGGNLVTVRRAESQGPEMVPGIAMIGDVAQDIGEGEEYPMVGVSDKFVTQPRKVKDGFIIAITDEVIWENKLSQVVERARDATRSLGITQELDRLSTVLGVTNTYSRNGGPQQSTYATTHTEGTFSNLVTSNALTDFTSVNTALQALYAQLDLDNGQPVVPSPRLQVIFPVALAAKIPFAFGASEVRQTNSSNLSIASGSPLQYLNATFDFVSNQYVSFVSGDSTSWWLGDFKGAFDEREVFPVQMFVEDRNYSAGFSRDLAMRFKVRRKSAVGVRNPQKVVKCTA